MRAIVLTLVLFVLSACEDQTSAQHLARARDYLDTSDHAAAIIELKNALILDGSSAEARWLLGKTYLETGEILAAEKELRRAEDLGWVVEDIHPALGKALLSQGKVEDVLALDYENLSDPTAARLLSTQALAALSDQQMDKASELVSLAEDKAPQLKEVKLARATVAVRLGDTDSALELIKEIQEETPGDSGAQWLKGQALLQRQEWEAAREALDQSIADSEGTAIADLITRAVLSVQLGDYEAAQADAEEVLSHSPENPVANYIVGVRHFQKKLYRKATSALNLARPVAQQFPLVLYYLSNSYLIEGSLDQAEVYGREFHSRVPDDIKGRKLLAAILLQQNKVKQVPDILQPVIDQNPGDVEALNFKANALLLDDQADIGMLLYARIAQLQPEWPIRPLPQHKDDMDWSDAGGKENQTTGSEGKFNFPQTDILSILNYLARKDLKGAIAAAQSYQFQDLEGLSPTNVLGRVYFAAGQPREAQETFEKVLKRDPGNPSANWSLAEMAQAANQPDTARHFYKVVLEHHHNDLETLLKLAALEAESGNTATMMKRLTQAARNHPTALKPHLKLAEQYLGSGNPEKVEPQFAELSALQRRSPRVLESTGLAQLALRRYADAQSTLQQLVKERPESARAHFLLGLAANETGDRPTTKLALQTVIEHDPEHVPALLALAKLARIEGEQELFDQYLATLVELAPDEPEVLRLRALSEQTGGNQDEALALSQRAFEQAPTTQSVLELASLQKAAEQNTAAHDTLEQWIKEHPRDIDARLFLANTLLFDDEQARAQEHYRAILELDPDNFTALNNLAWSLRQENPGEALTYIQYALELAPDHPQVLDSLAVIEMYNGQHDSARRNVRRALAAMPDNLTVRYHDAMIAAALGEKEEAIATLEDLVKKDASEFPERAEAQALLEKLRR